MLPLDTAIHKSLFGVIFRAFPSKKVLDIDTTNIALLRCLIAALSTGNIDSLPLPALQTLLLKRGIDCASLFSDLKVMLWLSGGEVNYIIA